MLLLDVAHPDGDFQAEFDPELRSLYSHSIHAVDLLWCLRLPDMIAPGEFKDVLMAMAGVVVVPQSVPYPMDAMDKSMDAKCRSLYRWAENFPRSGMTPGYNDVTRGLDDSDLHVDTGGVVITRAFRAASTIAVIARDALEQEQIELQSAEERMAEVKNIAKMFAGAPETSEFLSYQPQPGCALALPCLDITDKGPGTYHARPPCLTPRLLTRAFLKTLIPSLRVTGIQPIESSTLRDRAIARVYTPQGSRVAA